MILEFKNSVNMQYFDSYWCLMVLDMILTMKASEVIKLKLIIYFSFNMV